MKEELSLYKTNLINEYKCKYLPKEENEKFYDIQDTLKALSKEKRYYDNIDCVPNYIVEGRL